MADVVRKHKGSKKSKRSWRKHTDIADVEGHLEDVRRDERTGGTASDKVDDVIFFVDKDATNISKGKTKNQSKIQDDDIDDDEEVYVSKKQKFMNELVKDNLKATKRSNAHRASQVKNIWGQEVMTVTNSFLEPTIKKSKVKPSTVGVGKSSAEAISLPHPGASYNPDFDSHQELLNEANEEEVKKMKAQEKLNKKIKLVSVKELKNQPKVWLEEMSEGLFEDRMKQQEQVDSEDEPDQEKEEEEEEGTQQTTDPKTLKERRKEKERKELERKKLNAKREKTKLHNVYRIKTLKKEIQKSDKLSSERQRKRLDKLEEVRTKRLSKHKYNDGNIAVQLSEDLTGSLRELKPDGNLLEDRFKSLQKRNIIETRKPVVPRRKYKRKTYESRSHKSKTIKDFQPKNT